MMDIFSDDIKERKVENRGTAIEVVSGSALESIEKAAQNVQVATARQYPRGVSESLRKARDLVCYDPIIASECTFAIPRSGKIIMGKTIRLAEAMAIAWGNLRYGGRIIGMDNETLTAQGYAHDLETNVAVSVEVKRNIVDKYGRRFSLDLIRVTGQAAIAIAERNAIFKVIPGGYSNAIQREAQKVARGETEGLEVRLEKALKHFKSLGVDKGRVFSTLGAKGEKDITWHHIDRLIALATSLKTGEATVDELFPPEGEPPQEGRTSFGSKAKKEIPIDVPQETTQPQETPIAGDEEKLPEKSKDEDKSYIKAKPDDPKEFTGQAEEETKFDDSLDF